MAYSSDESRKNILDSITSSDPISGLLTPKANSFRLSVREALRNGREARSPGFGERAGARIRRPHTASYYEDAEAAKQPEVPQDAALNQTQPTENLKDREYKPINLPPPGSRETFRQYWEKHLDTYNASEIDKLFGQKDIGSLPALEALEKLPWLGKAMGWLSGIPILGGLIGKKGGEWAFNKFFDQKVWMSPTDPENPYRSDSDVSRDLNNLFNPDQYLPNSNNNYSTNPVDGSYTSYGTSGVTGDVAPAYDPSKLLQPGGNPNERGGLMPGYTGPEYGNQNFSDGGNNSITGNGRYNYATRINRGPGLAPSGHGNPSGGGWFGKFWEALTDDD